jgi:MinD-like ATPase involved in chromosome partitioning or flagellar assembly
MYMVLNKVPSGTDPQTLREHVESLYDAPVAGVLPLNSEIVRVASGGIFVNRFPDHPFSVELRRVAEKILNTGATPATSRS